MRESELSLALSECEGAYTALAEHAAFATAAASPWPPQPRHDHATQTGATQPLTGATLDAASATSDAPHGAAAAHDAPLRRELALTEASTLSSAEDRPRDADGVRAAGAAAGVAASYVPMDEVAIAAFASAEAAVETLEASRWAAADAAEAAAAADAASSEARERTELLLQSLLAPSGGGAGHTPAHTPAARVDGVEESEDAPPSSPSSPSSAARTAIEALRSERTAGDAAWRAELRAQRAAAEASARFSESEVAAALAMGVAARGEAEAAAVGEGEARRVVEQQMVLMAETHAAEALEAERRIDAAHLMLVTHARRAADGVRMRRCLRALGAEARAGAAARAGAPKTPGEAARGMRRGKQANANGDVKGGEVKSGGRQRMAQKTPQTAFKAGARTRVS